MTVVLTVGGANGGRDTIAAALQGYCESGGRRRHRVRYSQAMSSRSYREGRDMLRDDLAVLLGRGEIVELLCGSLGAEIAGTLLREWQANPATAPDPEQLQRIILLGNPERKHGGAWAAGWPWTRGFNGKRQPTPTNTPYRIDDIARAGDPFANADQWGVKDEDRRTAGGMFLARFLGGGEAHRNYDDIDIDACDERAVEGRTRFLVAP